MAIGDRDEGVVEMNYQVRTVVEIGPEQVRELHRVQRDPGALGALLEAVARAITEGRGTCLLAEPEGAVIADVRELRVNYRSHNAFGDSLLTLEALLEVDLSVDEATTSGPAETR